MGRGCIRMISRQCLLQVCEEIRYVLNTYREAQQRIGEATSLANVLWNRAVRHRCRMANERFNAAQAFCQHKHLEVTYNLIDIGTCSFELEGDHTSKAAHLALSQLIIRV